MKIRLLALFAALALMSAAFSQEFRGSISGAVSDASGAMIPQAKVIAMEVSTGTRVETQTDNAGHYLVPFLLPGDYTIAVKTQGFKEFLRKAVHLGAGAELVIDAHLEVGDASQTVEVVAEVPLVNNENASIGQAISTKDVENLPTNGGTPMMLANFAVGVIATSQPNQVLPFASGGGASWSIAGSPNQTSELMIDGVPDTTWDGRLAYSPPQDAVQEVRVKAFDSDPAYGHTGSGTANQILKSGGNSLHGTASWKNQPNTLAANSFFSNKSALPTPVTHFNQYGMTAGGPMMLPHYDGRNKLFWFFAYEGVRDSQPATTLMSVPTAAERTGDFSALLSVPKTSNTQPVTLYDPYSAVTSGTTITRTAYNNNVIPSSRLDAIAQKYMTYFAAPNTAGRADGYNNFASNAPSIDGYTNELGRLDYNFNARNRTYFNVRHTDYFQSKNNYFSNLSTGSFLSRSNWGGSVDHVFMVNASNVVNVRVNFTRMFEDHRAPSAGFDATTLGFPSYLASNALYAQLPYVQFNSNTGFQSLGMNGANTLPSQNLQTFGSWVSIHGNHTLKAGGDARQYRFNYMSYGNATGTFSFNNSYVRQASNASSTVVMGQDMASFLLGLPTGGQFDLNTSAMFYNYNLAGFVSDDWRIRRNLTINLGIRFEKDLPIHEKWGRTVNGFDTTSVNPLAAAAIAAYGKSPSPLLPASNFNVLGGLTFATDGAVYRSISQLWSPRVGLAWSPEKFNGKLVVRGGFGMFVQPATISTLQITGAYSTNPLLTQEGFSQTTTITPSNDNYKTPAATLGNPFPSGLLQPGGSSLGLLTYAGQNVNFINPEMQNPYSMRWQVGAQYALAKDTMLEVAYIGNRGVHLPVTYTGLNTIPAQYLSTAWTRDQAAITALTATVNNPFKGLQTNASSASTVATAQVLARFPQFPVGFSSGNSSPATGVYEQNANLGSSLFHSLNVRLEKRMSHGVSTIVNFMQSKLIEQVTWLNTTDTNLERRISPFDHPSRIAMAVVYELPVGRGRAYSPASTLVNYIAGGWNVTSTYTYQIGAPLTWVNGSTSSPGDYVYLGAPLHPNARNVDGTAFDVKAFDTLAANQFQYHIRTFSTTFPNVRQDSINQWDFSLQKNFEVREKARVQLRCEAFNVINHPLFGAANTTATNSAFGTITSQANRSRMLQLVARIVF